MNTKESEFLHWLEENRPNDLENPALEKLWNLENSLPEDQTDLQADWEKLESHMHPQGLSSSWFYRAAAVLIVLVSSSLIWMTQNDSHTVRCLLTDNKMVELSDGSQVQLSRGSVLKYDKNFGEESRLVELKGEASFEVQSGHQYPFMVHTAHTKIKVTGTRFQVSAFKEKNKIAVQVNEGKVLFYNSDILSPKAFRVGLSAGDIGVYLPKLGQLNKKQFITTP